MDIKQEQNPNRPLPVDRKQVQPFLYGIQQPKKVSLGKTTLGDALEFLTKYQGDPKNYNAKKISEQYFLAEDTVSKYSYDFKHPNKYF